VVHTSTIRTIGQPGDGTLATEETRYNLWDSASHYARSKYLGEVAALDMGEKDLPVVVVNPCAPVGPGDLKPTSTGQRLVDYMIGKMPSFASGGINFVSVDDVAVGHVRAAEKGSVGQRYILGHREGNLTLDGFLELMEQVSGVARPRQAPRSILSWLRRTAPPSHRPAALTCDPSKAIRELGLPQTPLATAFAAALAWFRAQGYLTKEG
jgi:dihydroflavonol-4-reductase